MYEYECKWEGQPFEANTWMTLEKLSELGFKKMLAEVDIRENSKMGLTSRPLTTTTRRRVGGGGDFCGIECGASNLWGRGHVRGPAVLLLQAGDGG